MEQCTSPDGGLPANKPRYVMGVGYAVDMVVCSILGADMFDCVVGDHFLWPIDSIFHSITQVSE